MAHPGKTGVLVIAHGSRSGEWNRLVDEAVAQVETEAPVTVGYLELVEGRLIPDGVKALQEKGVERILAVPLFVNSGSTHLEEIQYALGVKEHSRIETDLPRIRPRGEVIWCPAMDAHPRVAEILGERVAALSRRPREETLLLVAHGSEKPGFREVWDAGLAGLAAAMVDRFGIKGIDFAMLRTGDVRPKADALACRGRLLVVPVFLSRGYFTQTVVPKELEGIPHEYRGETFLPHPSVTRWIGETVERALAGERE